MANPRKAAKPTTAFETRLAWNRAAKRFTDIKTAINYAEQQAKQTGKRWSVYKSPRAKKFPFLVRTGMGGLDHMYTTS